MGRFREVVKNRVHLVEQSGLVLLPVSEDEGSAEEAVQEIGVDWLKRFAEVFKIVIEAQARGVFIRFQSENMLCQGRHMRHHMLLTIGRILDSVQRISLNSLAIARRIVKRIIKRIVKVTRKQ